MNKNNHSKEKMEKAPSVFKTQKQKDKDAETDRILVEKILADKDKVSEDYQGGEI